MSTGAIIAIVVVLAVVIAAAVFFLLPQLRSQRLRKRFGPEYEHTVRERGDRRSAERELAERESLHARYELRSLSAESRDNYRAEWTRAQQQFVDSPADSVAEADRLVNVLVAELGYPSEGYERQVADLSVRHAYAVTHYRTAHDARLSPDATTDDLRTALLGYRKLFEDLVEQDTKATGRDSRNGRDAAHDNKAVQR